MSKATGAVGSFVCCGVRIDELGPEDAVEALLRSHYGRTRRTHLCNAFTLSLALRDAEFMSLLNHSDINFADGHYVAMVGRWRGGKVMRERTYGPSLMHNSMDRGRSKELRHFLYGSTPETIALLTEALTERLPGVRIVGAESPPFRPLTEQEELDLLARVAKAKPDIFWVGLGTPLQDRFVEQYGERLNCTVVPVGAAFDFHAGTKATAPAFVQRVGMEWLFRFMNEPIRLWRRYLFGIPVFLAGVAADRRGAEPVASQLPAIPPQSVVPISDDRHTDGKSATTAA